MLACQSIRRQRGRPPKIDRDIAVLLGTQWFVRVEGLPTGRAIEALRELWHAQGRVGLGMPTSRSNAAFGCMRRADNYLGEGRFVVQAGVEAGSQLIGAGTFFVPIKSTLQHISDGRRQAIYGPLWRWPFGAEKAIFMDGSAPAHSAAVLPEAAEHAHFV